MALRKAQEIAARAGFQPAPLGELKAAAGGDKGSLEMPQRTTRVAAATPTRAGGAAQSALHHQRCAQATRSPTKQRKKPLRFFGYLKFTRRLMRHGQAGAGPGDGRGDHYLLLGRPLQAHPQVDGSAPRAARRPKLSHAQGSARAAVGEPVQQQ